LLLVYGRQSIFISSTGSVIPFIRIDDFKSTIKAQAEEVSKNKMAFATDVKSSRWNERKTDIRNIGFNSRCKKSNDLPALKR
jgi:hypothetical protein